MKKIYLFIIFGILLFSTLASAITWDMPTEVKVNDNFNIKIYGSGVYGIELQVPPGFNVVSDPSGGVTINGVYRTSYGSILELTLRAPSKKGVYVFKGQYTEGSGVKNFQEKQVNVYEPSSTGGSPGSSGGGTKSCPTCPSPSVWSNCESNQQARVNYKCSKETNYICLEYIETQTCTMPKQTCKIGWKCKDKNYLAYQSSDCSWSSIEFCNYGCNNETNQCNPKLTDQNNNKKELYKEHWKLILIISILLVAIIGFIVFMWLKYKGKSIAKNL